MLGWTYTPRCYIAITMGRSHDRDDKNGADWDQIDGGGWMLGAGAGPAVTGNPARRLVDIYGTRRPPC